MGQGQFPLQLLHESPAAAAAANVDQVTARQRLHEFVASTVMLTSGDQEAPWRHWYRLVKT